MRTTGPWATACEEASAHVHARPQSSLYGIFYGGTNVDGIVSPHLPIDDGSSQTNLHIDGLYLRATDVTKGGFYVSGADCIHISGQTYIRIDRVPKIVLDMNVAGTSGFWCDGLHGEGRASDAIHVIGSGKRLTDVFIRSLRLGATENAIHIDASRPNQPPGQIAVRNAHFEFLDIEAFRCTGDIRMEQKVDIITRGDEDAPQIILGQDFNGEIWGGDVAKLQMASRLMSGLYHDGVTNVVHDFKYWPVLTFADVRDERGEARPNIAGGRRFKTANSAPTTVVNFLNGQVGQEITILFDDNDTTIRHDGRGHRLVLQGGRDFRGQRGDMITLVKMGAGWVEKCRSINSSAP
jgi:hypothetical protein